MHTADPFQKKRASASWHWAPVLELASTAGFGTWRPAALTGFAFLMCFSSCFAVVQLQQVPAQSPMHQAVTPRHVLVLVPAFRAQAHPAFKVSRGRLRPPLPSASWSSWFAGSARTQVRLLLASLEHYLSARPVQIFLSSVARVFRRCVCALS